MTLQYTVVLHPIRIELGLSMNEYAVASAIYYLSTNPTSEVPGWCYAEKVSLGKMLGLSEQTIHTILKTLTSAGLVEKNPITKHLRTTDKWYNHVVVNAHIQTKDSLVIEQESPQNVQTKETLVRLKSTAKETLVGLKKSEPAAQESLVQTAQESLGNNNILDNNTDKDKKAASLKKTKSEEEYDNRIKELLAYFNAVRGKNHFAFKHLRSNFKYWSEAYSLEIMKRAIDNIELSNYWKDKMTPEMLLRRTNPRREEVDYIGELYNLTPSQTQSKGRRNLTQEWLAQQTQEDYGTTALPF